MKSPADVNARVFNWVSGDLIKNAKGSGMGLAEFNSAAVWWFCNHLSPDEQALAIGQFVQAHALASFAATASEADKLPPKKKSRRR